MNNDKSVRSGPVRDFGTISRSLFRTAVVGPPSNSKLQVKIALSASLIANPSRSDEAFNNASSRGVL